MRSIILIIGEDIRANTSFLNYIFKEYVKNYKELDDLKFIDKNNKNLSDIFDKLSRDYENIFVFASNETYHLVARVLATLTNDVLKLEKDNQTLAPSLSKKMERDSFLINYKDININVLKVEALQKLPKFLISPTKDSLYFYIFGYEISMIKNNLEDLLSKFEVELDIAQYSNYIIRAKATKNKFGDLSGFTKSICRLFNEQIIKNDCIFEFAVKNLRKIGAKISIAESLTGGLIASKICEIDGASEVFGGSLVTYSNEIKNIWLGVSEDILNTYGAVSKQCLEAMLDGTLEKSGASFAIAASGIAGPSGGSKELPVGTVFIGIKSSDGKKIIREYHLDGDRNYIREESANIAISMLIEFCANLFFFL
ncbi:NMN amidohydrolase [Campylobacter blaseri]|uniref:Damage-inducible protein CinA n=1 Tax=Campylobacter blaseri TaxID=2042961 RepID=A0A2P8R0J3_9BACT|nr:CinA family protein [Campylobacter blaseri]PSM52011.1 damage-inducible protein CinA [Campylobacter blaseri]PSM53796.1 damage-inducible protein CinA [Campylobacter blaseri]QKF85652.1 NMN amidohydrolase [Campylobacter blaseri]